MKLLKLLFLSICFMYACSDPCDEVNCLNGATCEDGSCICEDGFTGVNCELELREAYIGTWTGVFNCTNISEEDNALTVATIEDPNNPLGIIMDIQDEDVCATVKENGDITIPEKIIVSDGDSILISGFGGIVDNNDFIWTITTQLLPDEEENVCIFEFSK